MLNNIKSFGLNVIPDRQRTAEHTAQTVENAIGSMWEPILGYLKENDNVFSGAVLQEIDKLQAQTMRLTLTMGPGAPKTTINYES